ncbi:hypothetical protein FZC28_6810g3604 [Saccharomyces cerevisiae]|nr:hypothetical protein FZC28_6810g3604 [Saccharomyces cerevisiae]
MGFVSWLTVGTGDGGNLSRCRSESTSPWFGSSSNQTLTSWSSNDNHGFVSWLTVGTSDGGNLSRCRGESTSPWFSGGAD